mmetsp:Transcript_72288/g.172623  ORF Transcript_72288/g.172623 Transcript_72288/m.172623 type:complete len:195 (+) Transcript_72288:40-624(+)
MAGAVAAAGDGKLEVAFVCLGGEGGNLSLDPMSSGEELQAALQARMGDSKRSRIRLKLFNQCREIAKEDLLADHLQEGNDGLLEVQVMKQLDHVIPDSGHCAICTSCHLCSWNSKHGPQKKRCCYDMESDGRQHQSGQNCQCGLGDSVCIFCGVCKQCEDGSHCSLERLASLPTPAKDVAKLLEMYRSSDAKSE